jgi:hypothetical protein
LYPDDDQSPVKKPAHICGRFRYWLPDDFIDYFKIDLATNKTSSDHCFLNSESIVGSMLLFYQEIPVFVGIFSNAYTKENSAGIMWPVNIFLSSFSCVLSIGPTKFGLPS